MTRRVFAAAILAIALSATAHAQAYPTRPITLVVPYSAGGTFDALARIIGGRMGELLGQSVIIENVTGAGGITGVNRVVGAQADGYTVLLGTTGTHAYNQSIYKKRRYDALTDFTPVTLFSEQPMVLETRKDLAPNTFPEFVAYVKQNSAKMQYGSAGVATTSHLACALLNSKLGVNVTHVPYRGTGPAVNDLLGGQIDYLCHNLTAATPLISAKQVKGIALLSRRRSPVMPDLGTVEEQGIPDFDVTTWTALFLPKGAPKSIADKLSEAVHGAVNSPDIKGRLLDIGVTDVAADRRSPEYLAQFVKEEIARWEGPIKAAGLQQD